MTLRNDFFSIVKQESSSGSITAKIAINPNHAIFEGHFPGKPVVPGVCMLQVVLEVMEDVMKRRLRLTNADAMKFLAVMDPTIHHEVEAAIKYTTGEAGIHLTANLFSGPVIFFKLKATLTPG